MSLNGESGHQSTIKFKVFKLLKSMKKNYRNLGRGEVGRHTESGGALRAT